ncbi:MAG: alpha-amylase family glycosyl hydrolase [Solirubrobacteraceae bacterium]
MRLPARPTIYEINTAVWLGDLSRQTGRPVDLGNVPGGEWDRLAALRVDAVWLMGVWRRSPAGLAIARRDPELMSSFRATLPDLRDDDVIGSPYCVRDYDLEPRFGAPEALTAARAELASRGLGLILDYVPNHVAPDHPWTADHADYFIRGTAAELEADPASFLLAAGEVLAHGKDPYFAPWPDVVQLNAFSGGLRAAVIHTLISIGERCDGIRCDMAMLMCNEVFAHTWGERAGVPPAGDYWPAILPAVRRAHPDLAFIAEAYWDMEWTLQQQGFDYCYDKRLYDRLVNDGAPAVRGHLHAAAAYQERLVRFIENHDEPRAADTFSPEKERAAAVVMSTLEGARLYHAGQLDGLHTHIPVFLARGPEQPEDRELRAFYDKLMGAVADSNLRDGDWRLCECTGWPDNASAEQLVAWCWSANGQRHLVVVNLAPQDAQARVRLPWTDLAGHEWQLRDALNGAAFDRDGGELQDQGLYVGMRPWESYFLSLTA